MRKIALVFLFVVSSFVLSAKNALAATALIGTPEIYQERDGKNCNFLSSCVQAGDDLHIVLKNIAYSNGAAFPDGEKVGIYLDTAADKWCWDYPASGDYLYVEVQNSSIDVTVPGSKIDTNCAYSLKVKLPANVGGTENNDESIKIYPSSPVASLQCDSSDEQCNEDMGIAPSYELCSQQIAEGTKEFDACQACFDKQGVWTAVGCIPSNPESLIKTVIVIGLAIGGGVVLIMILAGSFMLSTSQGDPNKTKEAKEIITSAIIGLLFVIFSVTILQFIGVSILRIPGFGE